MDVQEQSKGSGSNMFASKKSVTSSILNEPLYSNEDHSLKVRKPYTITKQRERWTDEEHKKFIEALKLYGRAWRRIEEHVGTKTAVQIRSHAQKFFSKVVREINTSSTEPIEIPPPRPKRKPAHPYPRKLIDTPRNGTLFPEQSIGSISPILSISEHENQSPMSVLSAFCSDTLGSADSNLSNGSLSPVSSSAQAKHGPFSEPSASNNDGGLTLSLPEAIDSSPDEQTPESMELFPQLTSSYKEGSEEQAPSRILKLFGRTVVITNSCKPTFPTESCKSRLSKIDDKRQSSNVEDTGCLLANAEYHRNQLCHEAPGSLYFIQHDTAESNNRSSVLTTPVARWNPGVQFPFLSLGSAEPKTDNPGSNAATVKEAEVHKEVSISGSSDAGALNENNRSNIGETPYHQFLLAVRENFASPIPHAKSSEKPVLFMRRQTNGMCKQGFVPYKRCMAERDSQSSSIIDSERKKQRMHLCL